MTIVADLTANHLSEGVTLQIFCGSSIAKIASKIVAGKAELIPFDIVIIHAGTYAIDNRAKYNSIISDYGNLVSICKRSLQSRL